MPRVDFGPRADAETFALQRDYMCTITGLAAQAGGIHPEDFVAILAELHATAERQLNPGAPLN